MSVSRFEAGTLANGAMEGKAMDISRLGIAVESRTVDDATHALEKFVQVSGSAERAAKGVGKEATTSGRAAAAANDNAARSANSAALSYGKWEAAARMVSRAVVGITAALGIGALISYADAWSDMQSVVGAAIRDMDAAPAMMDRLTDIANQSYSSIEQTTTAYARNVSVLRDLGRGAEDAATFTASLNNALVLTATRGERAASVQDALSKAMAVGKLQADGLETVLANGGAVAEALAASLGTTVNGLRQMATDGKITSRVISDTLIKSADEFAERVEEMPSTVQDAMLRLRNNLTRFIGQMDGATGASARMSDAIMIVANNIEAIGRSAFVAATAIGTYYTQALVRATLAKLGFTSVTTVGTAALGLFTGAVTVARTAVNALTVALSRNPLGLIAVVLATALSYLVMFGDQIAISTDGVVTFQDYAVAAFNGIAGAIQSVGTYFSETFGELPAIAMTAFGAIGVAVETQVSVVTTILKALFNFMIGGMKSAVEASSILIQTGLEHGFTAAGQLAYNAMVEWLAQIVSAAVNAANEVVVALSAGINSVNQMTGWELPNPFEKLDFDAGGMAGKIRGWKTEVTGAVGDASAEIDAIIQGNMSRDYASEIGSAWSDAAQDIAEARRKAQSEAEAGLGGGLGKPGETGGSSKAAEKAAREAQRLAKAYEGIVTGAERHIAASQAEAAALGQTAEQAAALKYQTDMLNQARDAGINLTAAQTDQLMGLGAQMASTEAATAGAADQIEFSKQTTRGFVDDLRQGLNAGEGLWESFANAATKALDRIMDKMLDMAFDGMFAGGGGGGGLGGILGSIFGGGFGSGTVSSGASASILSGSFGGLFANGGTLGAGKWGIAGENGPEIIKGPAQVIPNHQTARMQAPANSQPVINQTFVNAPPVKETREESDGRGGRHQTVVFDEAIAGTVNRPGSKSSRAVGSEFGLKKRIIR